MGRGVNRIRYVNILVMDTVNEAGVVNRKFFKIHTSNSPKIFLRPLSTTFVKTV